MIDKKKIGKFIKQNREKHNWSQEQLAEKISNQGEEISAPSIAHWEQGKNLPSLNHLNILSQFFKVSIDDLLEGEKISIPDFSEKFPLLKEPWKSEPSDLWFLLRQKEIIKIEKRFNELINLYANDSLTTLEDKELAYILNNFYEFMFENAQTDEKDVDFYLKANIPSSKLASGKSSLKKKRFEIKSHVFLKEEYCLNFVVLGDAIIDHQDILFNRFDALEPYEKDMFFNMIQAIDPYSVDYSEYGSNSLKRYKEEHGTDFNKDNLTKNAIKFFIEHGASINPFYHNFNKEIVNKYREIERAEELFLKVEAPLIFYDYKKENPEYYYVKNTKKNLFLSNHYYELKRLIPVAPDELYKIFIENDEIPKDYLMEYAKKSGINLNQKEEYIYSDLNIYAKFELQAWDKAKEEFKQYDLYKKVLESSIEKLKNGKYEYVLKEQCEYGGNEFFHMLFMRKWWTCNATFEEINNQRDLKLTKELYENLDNLSIKEIKDKYFPILLKEAK